VRPARANREVLKSKLDDARGGLSSLPATGSCADSRCSSAPRPTDGFLPTLEPSCEPRETDRSDQKGELDRSISTR
jgi:hypothetical protein